MKKIDLQLTERQLNSLVYYFNLEVFTYSKTREERVLRSIVDEVALKIKKKHLEVQLREKNLFEKPKKIKFTFKYHEAHALEQFVVIAERLPLNEYDRNAALFIIGKLNQLLA